MSEEEKEALKTIKEELQDEKQAFKYYKGVLGLYSNGEVEILLKLIDKQKEEIEDFKNIKKEHQIMKRIILENGLWETLLNDNEFNKHLNEEN